MGRCFYVGSEMIGVEMDNKEQKLKQIIAKSGVYIIFIVIVVVFAILTKGLSIRLTNIRNVLSQVATIGLLTIGMTMVIIDGGIDLSVGGIVAFSASVGSILMTRFQLPWLLCVFIMLLLGLTIGFINGFSIAVLKFQPFICTMATLKIFTGLANFFLGGLTIYGLPEQHAIFGQKAFLNVPICVWILAFFTIIAVILMKYSNFGRELYAMGGNRRAAWTSGINITRNRIIIYMISGFMCSVASLIYTSKLMSAQSSIGEGTELDAIASAVIGGVSMSGGEGNIFAAIVGALVIVMLNNGLNLMRVSPYIQTAVKGAVIFFAVLSDVLRRRKELQMS